MSTRHSITIAIAALFGLTIAGLAAGPAAKPPPKGDADYRAAWLAFAAPASDPNKAKSLDARQQARMAAIPLMEAAVAADPRNWAYQESLGYICLTAGRYDKAKTAIDKAIGMKRDRPLLYMLRGQAEAALAQMDPPEAAKNIGPAISAFDRAGQLDPNNALPLLQAASVAFDVDRPDLAVSRVSQALQRPGSMLYTLTVPTDLSEDKGASVRAWQYAQLGHWYELLARFRNDVRLLLKRGAALEQRGDLGGADQQYRWALQTGRMVGAMAPNLFLNVASGIDMMEDAYRYLARVSARAVIRGALTAAGEQAPPPDYQEAAKALIRGVFAYTRATPEQETAAYADWKRLDPPPTSMDDTRWNLELLTSFYIWLAGRAGLPRQDAAADFDRWTGEAGVVTFARGQLAAGLSAYVKQIGEMSAPTVQELLMTEAKIVAPVISGIGLTPQTTYPPPAGKPSPQPKPAGVAGDRRSKPVGAAS